MGIKVDHVEVKNINPPQAILTAEGRKQSSTLITEGEKKVAVLAAEAKARPWSRKQTVRPKP